MEIWLISALLLLVIITVIFPVTILLRSFLNYKSILTIELVLTTIFINIWSILLIPVYLSPDNLTYLDRVHLEHFSTLMGSTGAVLFIFVIGNSFPKRYSIISRLTVVNSSLMIGIKFIHFFIPISETVYGLKVVGNDLIKVIDPVIQILIFLQFFTLFMTVAYYTFLQLRLPSGFASDNTKFLLSVTIIIGIIGTILNIASYFLFIDTYDSGIVALISRICYLLAFIFILFQVTNNPLLNFSENGNSFQFIENGLIGYLLVGNRNKGPENLISSSKFQKNYKIDNLDLLSVKLISTIGLGNKGIDEGLFTIPFSYGSYGFTTISLSFSFQDSEIQDPRKKGKCDLVYVIILPDFLFPYIKNFKLEPLKKSLFKFFKDYNNLSLIIANVHFENLSSVILRDLTSNSFYN
jgi:hypothetical protein